MKESSGAPTNNLAENQQVASVEGTDISANPGDGNDINDPVSGTDDETE